MPSDTSKDTKLNSFEEFQKSAKKYGAKAAGISLLPGAWCPAFHLLPTVLHSDWTRTGKLDNKTIDDALAWASSLTCDRFMVRSSGANERIGDRGKYQSVLLQRPIDKNSVTQAITSIFDHAQTVDPAEKMGVIIQEFVEPLISGHMSNEVRVSPTRNQWKYDTEKPVWHPSTGINSKFAPLPDLSRPIVCGKDVPHQALRSIGKWMTENIGPRCHIEWLTTGSEVFLVQLDLEWTELDEGFDPRSGLKLNEYAQPRPSEARMLKLYEIGTETPWKKLKNLSEFGFSASEKAPKIFLLSATDLKDAYCSDERRTALINEVRSVTGDRAVVRTDCKDSTARPFNLPRTDTVSASQAVEWAALEVPKLVAEGMRLEDIGFLIHAFLPSAASAWAYSRPGDPTVIVDALWGLPDGLQVLPVDTYEVNVVRDKIIGTKSTYKPRFLRETPDGAWVYEDIKRSKGRSKVLGQTDILEIAKRTADIASALGEDAQIMWFCGIPDQYAVGKNLPWFRSREKLDTAPRIEVRYKPFEVRNQQDLLKLPDREAMIKLAPDVDLIRDDKFLQDVIDAALEKRLPVQLEGSILGHTYYRLVKAGVAVALVNAPKYYRKRELQTFGKIVRDKIATKIQGGGEAVVEALLDKADLSRGLAGKLVEELEEFLLAKDIEARRSELADMLEVLIGMSGAEGIDWPSVLDFADAKRVPLRNLRL